ncbi:MAG: YhjD/YihY/BrkB family envelope integrity protein [Prosthecobacter sp.]
MNAPAIKVTWMELLKRSVNAWTADKAMRLSAALSYYSVFSIAPLLVITIAAAGMVLDDDAVAGRVHAQMKVYIGSPAAAALESMVKSAAKPADSIVATITGFVALLLGASGVFAALKDALNTIWEVKPKKGTGIMAFAQEKFFNFGMVLVIGFLLLVSLLLSTAIATLHDQMEVLVRLPAFVWTGVSSLVSMAVATTLFAWIFKVLPDVSTRWKDVWIGAFITAILFEIGKTGLSWYLGRESTAGAYGAAGSVVLLLLWVYYASCILLFGAEFTQEYARSRGRILVPEGGQEWATAGDRAKEGMDHQEDAAATEHAMPQVGAATVTHAFGSPLFAPLLKYIEGRGLLLSIEAKEAFKQILGLLALVLVGAVVIFTGWLLLANALVEWIVQLTQWSRMQASLAAGGVHVLIALILGLWIWRSLSVSRWFADTLNEFRKDRTWLRGHHQKR